MALLTYILLLNFLNHALAIDCVNSNIPEYITWEEELLKDLKCGYNRYDAPSENTLVNITYGMKAFKFNSIKQQIAMHTFMHIKWTDERLKWDPEKYHGINEIDSSKLQLWYPKFGLSNKDDYELYFETYLLYRYELKSTGAISMAHSIVQNSLCTVKLTNWPYDVQECNYDFGPIGPQTNLSGSANYSINFYFVVLEHSGAEWYMYNHKYVKDNSTKRNVKLTLNLMREAVGLAAIVIYPAFILTVLSVLSLCLDVRRKVRLAIVCFSLLGHYYFLTELATDIPKGCQFPPTLLLYYRGSVVLTIITILLTFCLNEVCKLKSTPHSNIKTINDFVYENKFRSYLVFPRWDCNDATVDSKSSNEDWVKFANIVNSVFIFVIVFAYIGLYGTSIPKKFPKSKYHEYYST